MDRHFGLMVGAVIGLLILFMWMLTKPKNESLIQTSPAGGPYLTCDFTTNEISYYEITMVRKIEPELRDGKYRLHVPVYSLLDGVVETKACVKIGKNELCSDPVKLDIKRPSPPALNK